MGSNLKILTVIGARPQIIKAAAISRAVGGPFKGHIEETLLHTGQHYDDDMSRIFFDELEIPRPDIMLEIGSGTHACQTAGMMQGIERAINDRQPDVVLLYGDTNSTLAGAIVASKLKVPIAHVEAGLRSFNRSMPEEINRLLCDHVSTWLFCPTRTAVNNLRNEGIVDVPGDRPSMDGPRVIHCGDVMFDNSMHYATLAKKRSDIMERLGLSKGGSVLMTMHRDHNVDDPEKLTALIRAMLKVHRDHGLDVVLPLHPRTRLSMEKNLPSPLSSELGSISAIKIIEPVGFLDMIQLERNAALVMTDSGGVQKEAYFFGVPVVILRNETEWVELVEEGMAILAGTDEQRISSAVAHFLGSRHKEPRPIFGDGNAAELICQRLLEDVRNTPQ